MQDSKSSNRSLKKMSSSQKSPQLCANCRVLASALQLQTRKVEELDEALATQRQKEKEISQVCVEIAQQAKQQLLGKEEETDGRVAQMEGELQGLSVQMDTLKSRLAHKEQEVEAHLAQIIEMKVAVRQKHDQAQELRLWINNHQAKQATKPQLQICPQFQLQYINLPRPQSSSDSSSSFRTPELMSEAEEPEPSARNSEFESASDWKSSFESIYHSRGSFRSRVESRVSSYSIQPQSQMSFLSICPSGGQQHAPNASSRPCSEGGMARWDISEVAMEKSLGNRELTTKSMGYSDDQPEREQVVKLQGEREKMVAFASSMRSFLQKLNKLLNGFGQPHHITFQVPQLPQVSLVHTGLRFAHFLDNLVNQNQALEHMADSIEQQLTSISRLSRKKYQKVINDQDLKVTDLEERLREEDEEKSRLRQRLNELESYNRELQQDVTQLSSQNRVSHSHFTPVEEQRNKVIKSVLRRKSTLREQSLLMSSSLSIAHEQDKHSKQIAKLTAEVDTLRKSCIKAHNDNQRLKEALLALPGMLHQPQEIDFEADLRPQFAKMVEAALNEENRVRVEPRPDSFKSLSVMSEEQASSPRTPIILSHQQSVQTEDFNNDQMKQTEKKISNIRHQLTLSQSKIDNIHSLYQKQQQVHKQLIRSLDERLSMQNEQIQAWQLQLAELKRSRLDPFSVNHSPPPLQIKPEPARVDDGEAQILRMRVEVLTQELRRFKLQRRRQKQTKILFVDVEK